MEDLDSNGRQVMIIVGIIMLVFGSIGNLLNICVFSKWSHLRRRLGEHNSINQSNNSSLYLLVSSISNLIILIYPLLTRILCDGFNYSITNNVFLLCNLRYYILHTCDLISLTCICMATFDRYLITSRNVHLRQLSTTKRRTIQIIFLIILFHCCHGIPIPIYFNLSNNEQCQISSKIYLYYYLYMFQIFLHGIIPILFLSIFGTLTFKHLKNLQHHVHSNHDKQLSHMLFLMSFAIIISSVPYCIQQIYNVKFALNDSQESSLVFLLRVISTLLFYTNPVASFYIYFISTPNFRHQIKKMFHVNRKVHPLSHNQIHTITTPFHTHL